MEKSPVYYAFIDSQNLHLAVQEYGWELDFKRLRVYLQDKYRIVKTFLFIGYVPGNEHLEKQEKLLHVLIPNPKKYSALLRRFHKYFIYIAHLEQKLGKTKKGSNLRTKP